MASAAIGALEVAFCGRGGYHAVRPVGRGERQAPLCVIDLEHRVGLVTSDAPAAAAHAIDAKKFLAGGILVRERVANEGVCPVVDAGHCAPHRGQVGVSRVRLGQVTEPHDT